MGINNLHGLLHRLHKSELEQCRTKLESKKLLHLFDLLLQYPMGIPQKMEPQFQQLNVGKEDAEFLQDLVVETLYSKTPTLEEQVRNLIRKANWHTEQKQYHLCIEVLKEAKIIAEKYEFFDCLIDIATLEFELMCFKVNLYFEPSRYDINRYIKLANNYSDYQAIYKGLDTDQAALPTASKVYLTKLLDHVLIADESKALSIKAQLLLYQIKARVYYFLENYEQAQDYVSKVLVAFDIYPQFVEIDSNTLIFFMANDIDIAMQLKEYEKASQRIQELLLLPEQYYFSEIETIQQIRLLGYFAELTLYLKQQQYQKILPIIDEIQQIFPTAINQMHFEHQFKVFISAAWGLFIFGYHQEALDLIESILYEKGTLNPQFRSEARQLKLLILWELKDRKALVQYIGELNTYLASVQKRYTNEMLLIGLIYELLQPYVNRSPERIFKEYQDIFSTIEEDRNNIKKHDIIDVMAWLDSQLKQAPILERLLSPLSLTKTTVFGAGN